MSTRRRQKTKSDKSLADDSRTDSSILQSPDQKKTDRIVQTDSPIFESQETVRELEGTIKFDYRKSAFLSDVSDKATMYHAFLIADAQEAKKRIRSPKKPKRRTRVSNRDDDETD